MTRQAVLPGPTAAPSIAALRHRLRRAGTGAHEALLDSVLRGAATPAAAPAFTQLFEARARQAARAADERSAAGPVPGSPVAPLAGLPVSVKALFDVAGEVTHAGAALRRDAAPATQDATVVARLAAAGAVLLGHTHMTEFAFSGVGLNPHWPLLRNPCDSAVARIPGGSSSGAAVSVALGLAVAGLGSDTGGSIRIPAALCGLVGFKNTQRRTPLDGAFPLSPSLDTTCAMTRCVADALLVDGVLSAAPLAVTQRAAAGLRLALPPGALLDGMDAHVARAFERALAALSRAGAQIVDWPLPELAEIADIQRPASLAAIEAWAVHRGDMATQRERFDPRVSQRIATGKGASAADHQRLLQRRADWIARMSARLDGFDAFVCPTVPIVAPEIAPLQAGDEAFFAANAQLLRNTAVANFLDGCAFSLPCHRPGELPVGLMLTAPGGHDAALGSVALAVETVLAATAA